MPYSFIEIEKRKKTAIVAIFLFVVALYFLSAQILWIITKGFFILEAELKLKTDYPKHFILWKEVFIVFLLSFLAAALHWAISIRHMQEKILKALAAQAPDLNDAYHRAFQNIIEEVCVACGGQKIQGYVIASSALNAFALADFRGNKVIGISEGLLARLNRSQLEAVVGHEAAHLIAGDSLLKTVSCSIFGLYSALLEGIERGMFYSANTKKEKNATGVLYLMVIYLVLSLMRFFNFLLNMFLSREQEYRADALAVRLTRNPLALAEALYIIGRSWRGAGQISDSLGSLFIVSPKYKILDEETGWIAELFSTHPPLKARLSILISMAHTDINILKENIKPKLRIAAEQGTEIMQSIGNLCPECKTPLFLAEYEGAQIEKCSSCAGLLVKEDVLRRILIREDFSFSQSIAQIGQHLANLAYLPKEKYEVSFMLDCPYCQKKMQRKFFNTAYLVQIDYCPSCQVIWFDKNELEVIQYLSEKYRRELNKE